MTPLEQGRKLSTFSIIVKIGLSAVLGLTGLACAKKKGTETQASKSPDDEKNKPDNAAGFYIRVAPPKNVTYTIHRDVTDKTDFSKPCEIAPGTASPNHDIMCIIEATELDLGFHGLNYYFNVPASMCDYVKEEPYYYFRSEPGQGPISVTFTTTSGVVNPSSVVVVPAGYATVSSKGAVTCKYDYSFYKGPNCCVGEYQLTKTETVGGAVTSDLVSWGGKIGACARGPAMTGPLDPDSGLPSGLFYETTGEGENKEYKISNGGVVKRADIFAANYFDPTQHAAGGGYPKAFNANQSPTSPLLPAPMSQPYYTYTCYNHAEETPYRIRFMIREWNLLSEFLKGGAGNPESTSGSDNFGSPIDDRWDWNSLENLQGILWPGTLGD